MIFEFSLHNQFIQSTFALFLENKLNWKLIEITEQFFIFFENRIVFFFFFTGAFLTGAFLTGAFFVGLAFGVGVTFFVAVAFGVGVGLFVAASAGVTVIVNPSARVSANLFDLIITVDPI
jgi:hypothetical protein